MTGLSLSSSVARKSLPVLTIVAAVVAGVWFGVEIALLVVAAGALAGVIALLWASVQALTGESPLTLDEALTLGAPSAEEEQKRAVLRALKDLEFERSVGKIGEDDYAELSARYRADAKRLIQLIDAGSEAERARVEAALAARLEKPDPKPEPELGPDSAPESEAPEADEATPATSDSRRAPKSDPESAAKSAKTSTATREEEKAP